MCAAKINEGKRPRVLVSMNLGRDCYRKVFEGVLKRSRECDRWELCLDMTPRTDGGIPAAADSRCDAMLLLYSNPRQMEAVARFKGPALILHPPQPLPAGFPRRPGLTYIVRDQAAISRVVANYFLARHYRSFAFLGEGPGAGWSTGRETAFVTILRKHGFGCPVFRQETGLDQKGTIDYGRIGRWLRELPHPAALFAANDRLARLALDVSRREALSVPGEIAILGVDNDIAVCETATPSLSSVSLGHANLGERCVELLAGMLAEPARPCRCLALGLPEVISRRSTDAFCFKDPLIIRAFQLMAAETGAVPSIARLAVRLGLSRRMLEIRARRELGHSLKEEMQSLRLARAATLLGNTRLTTAEIAARCGFYDASHLARSFKARYAATPQAYRDLSPATASRQGAGRQTRR